MKKWLNVASFDVDAENGFTPLCPHELPVPGGIEIVDELNAQALLGNIRVCSKDAHPRNPLWKATKKNPILSKIDKGPNMDVRWPLHCVVGTYGFQLIKGLPSINDGYHFVVYKGLERDFHPYGACYHDLNEQISTGVIEFLRQNSIDTVLIGGLATEYCVKTTALQLREAGFIVIVNLAACRGIDQKAIKRAIREMKVKGIIIVKNAAEIEKFL